MKKIILFLLILQLNSFILNDIDNALDGKTITAVLRLKKVDYNYYTITFYDEENVDIKFDLLKYYKMKKYKKEYKLKNIHPGAEYTVEFKLIDNNNDFIEGEMVSYIPVFLNKLP